MMKLRIVATVAIAVMLWACSKVPITNRRQFHLLPESELITIANTEYNKFLATKTKVPDTDANTIMVKKSVTIFVQPSPIISPNKRSKSALPDTNGNSIWFRTIP
jgi:hypothetical protein